MISMKEKLLNIKRKYMSILLVLIMLVVFVVVLGSSYAFFTTTVKGKEFVIYTGNLKVDYTKKTDVINVDNLYPMTNQEGLNTTPHEFIVTNNGSITARYQVRLELDNDNKNQIPVEYIKLAYSIDNSTYSEPILLSNLNSNLVFLKDIILEKTKSNTIGIKLWIDINAPNDIQGKEFKAQVVVDSIQNVEDGYVVDTKPIIYLNKTNKGTQDINLKVNDTYTELGVERVEDDKDIITKNQVSKTYEYFDGSNLTTVDKVDTSKTGIYYVTYSVTDSNNNTGKTIRIVTVNNTSTIPSIILNGDTSITLGENDYYKESGVTVENNNQVITIGEVKTSKVGTYTLRYIVIDSNNNFNSVVRTVEIKKYTEELLNGADPVLTSNLVPVKIQDDGTVLKASTASEWYDYETKQWANAVVLRSNYDNNKLYDLSGNGNNATIYGATITDEGLYFDGIDDYAKIDLLKWDSANEFTIEFKAKIDIEIPEGEEHYTSILFESSGDANSNDAFFIDTEEYGTKDILLTVRDNTNHGYNIKYADNVVNDSEYYTYTVTFNAKNNNNDCINIYVNGVKKELSVYKDFNQNLSNFILGDHPFFIGSRNGAHYFSKMTLNSLKIYNRELTEYEIKNNMKDIVATDNLLVAYDLDNDYQYYIENNEVIPEDNIESYFVWIPKYSYQLWDLGNYSSLTTIDSTKPHAIPIKFGTSNTTDTNTGECTTPMNDNGTQGLAGESGNCEVGDYMTHPAFLAFDTNGLWVGKFETGINGVTSTETAKVNGNDANRIIIKPNVYSWRGNRVGNMFKASAEYMRNEMSHMMKNTEWGAVAYLSHSNYGINDEIRINNNSAFITGYSSTTSPTIGYNNGESIEGNRIETTSLGVDGTYTVNYSNNKSVLSSTTGNYSGIYDISGGAWEYVMGYTTGTSIGVGGSSEITTIYTDFFTNSGYEKYYDKYSSTSMFNYNNRILGDATGEIGPYMSQVDLDTNTRYKSSWYNDFVSFASSSNPWFARGGEWTFGSLAGAFAFSHSTGSMYAYISYRIVLAPTK